MLGVLEGFGIIAVVIVVGYLVERLGVLGEGAQRVLARTVFFVAAPCLLFTVIAAADPGVLISPMLAVAALAAVASSAIAMAAARFGARKPAAEVVIAGLSAGYVNSNNIGLPVAVYVLGSAAYTAPVLLLQLVVFTPVALLTLDHAVLGGRWSISGTLLATVRNPLVIGSLLGFVVAMAGWHIPTPVLEPLRLMGGASVPLMLMGFGMTLHGSRALEPGSGRGSTALSAALKLVFMPLLAWMLGAFVFRLDPVHLHAAVVMAALPTAQNVLNYAQRFERGEVLARDTILITTVGAVPVLLLVSLLLAP